MSEGLGTLAEEPKAIFFQKSKSLQAEFGLISLVTQREQLVNSLKKLVQDMAVGSRKQDCGAVTEFFTLIHKIREATCDLVEGVLAWQQGFTQNIRPQLMSVDYLVTMITSVMFVSGSTMKKLFAFSLGPFGNIFMLPAPVVTTTRPPHKCDEALLAMVHNFANPDELRMINCYKILKNCLAAKDFDRLHPIEYWMNNKWAPHVTSAMTSESDRWFLTGGHDVDEAPVKVHKNFLRKSQRNFTGIGLNMKGGESNKNNDTRASLEKGGVGGGGGSGPSETGGKVKESSMTATTTSSAPIKGNAPKGGTDTVTAVSGDGDGGATPGIKVTVEEPDSSDDEENPKINFREIIQNTFKGAPVENFGASVPIDRAYARETDYMQRENRDFSVDALIEEVDKLGKGKKSIKPNYLALSKEKAATKNAFADAEEARVKAELEARRAAKGLAAEKPPSPPKTIEEAADRMATKGLSSEAFRTLWLDA